MKTRQITLCSSHAVGCITLELLAHFVSIIGAGASVKTERLIDAYVLSSAVVVVARFVVAVGSTISRKGSRAPREAAAIGL